jgi:hypothetical protein
LLVRDLLVRDLLNPNLLVRDLLTPGLLTPDLPISDLRWRKSSRVLVGESMASTAQRDQILRVVRSALGAGLQVVDLEKVR